MRKMIPLLTTTLASIVIAAPVFAACNDQVVTFEERLRAAKVSSTAMTKISMKLREAKRHAARRNEAGCMSAVKEARRELAVSTGGTKK